MRRIGQAKKKAIVARMIELLEPPGGWIRGRWQKRNPAAATGYSYCLLGAAQQAYEDVYGRRAKDDNGGGAIAEQLSLVALIRAKTGAAVYEDPGTTVFKFNDDRQNTSKQDVIDLLNEKLAELS